MPRTLEVVVPSALTDTLLDEVQELDELLGLRVQRGVSLQPPGDMISLEISNRSSEALMRLLERHGIGQAASTSLSTSQPITVVSPPRQRVVIEDSSEATWEEMHMMLGKTSNTTSFGLFVMATSGALAAVGLATSAIHLVVGAMLIAPGFEPLVRLAMGIMVRNIALRRGLLDTLRGYGALVLGALLTGGILRLFGSPPLAGPGSYLPEGVLVTYWSTVSPNSIFVAAVAGAAGATLIWTDRAVLTSGVMVALALVPTPVIAALGLLAGRLDLVGQGLLRWAVEVALVVGASLLVFWVKRATSGRPRSLL